MNPPVVSVVMVACSVDRYLAESIESILSQTFAEFEFVIVDFGSTDRSLTIISEYARKDSRIKAHVIAHCGLAEARNVSCSFAKGKYIAIMDADDVSVQNRLLWQVEFLETHHEVSVLGGAVEWINSGGTTVATFGNPLRDDEIRAVLLNRCPFWHATVLMRRDAFASIGGYRPPFAQAEDYDLWLRMAEHFQLANLKKVLLKYRIHPDQVSIRKRAQQTLSILAAQVAASSRKSGTSDPLNSIKTITPEVLAGLGVTMARQQRELSSERRDWIRYMCMAGEFSAALKAALDALRSDVQYLERWEMADLYLTVARLHWKQGRPLKSVIGATRAVLTHPLILGRPLKPLLRRLGLV